MNWNRLHTFYFCGSIVTIICSSTVILSYILTPELRYNPSAIIFYRCIINFLSGICLGFLYFMEPSFLANNSIICSNVGHCTLFLYLCSMFYLIKLTWDLRTSIKNPFSSPYSGGITKSNILIITVAIISSMIVRLDWGFYYGPTVQFCAIKTHELYDLNPYNIVFVWCPLLIVVAFSIFVTIYSFIRLRSGLPNTFIIRREVIRNAWLYCIIYTLYFATVSICYGMTWFVAEENSTIWYKLFALSISGVSIADLMVFFIINKHKCCDNINSTPLPFRNLQQQHEQQLSAVQATQLNINKKYNVVDDEEDDNDIIDIKPKKKSICSNIGISIIDNENNIKINYALRREILAYTTDGIVQAVIKAEYQKTMVSDLNKDYLHFCPKNINKYDPNINAFQVHIKYNKALLQLRAETIGSSETIGINMNECCIKSMQAPNEEAIKEREFVDYAPLIFSYIRTHIIGISNDEYKQSIIPENKRQQVAVLDSVKCGEGKSGAFFYISHDGKYVVKTIPKHEVKKLIQTLPDYVKYLKKNTQTILSKYVGLHSIKIYGLTMYFVAMENVFISDMRPNEIYDLKGSWIGRYTNYTIPTTKTMKDLDLKRQVILNSKKRSKILRQLKSDTLFLQKHYIMDYSLLLGICYVKIEFGNFYNEPMNNTKLNVISEDAADYMDNDDDDDNEEEKINANGNGIITRQNTGSDYYLGGIRADIMESPGLYYFGIIDTLQSYNFRKRMETWFKTYIQRHNALGISCIDPKNYRDRFIKYMESIIISGEKYKANLNIENKFEKEQILIYPSTRLFDNGLREKSQSIAKMSWSKKNSDQNQVRESLLYDLDI
eukprot:355334_1